MKLRATYIAGQFESTNLNNRKVLFLSSNAKFMSTLNNSTNNKHKRKFPGDLWCSNLHVCNFSAKYFAVEGEIIRIHFSKSIQYGEIFNSTRSDKH
ncbi:ER membrane protein complex subunit [Trichinella spiralis]|uniref:ER membrane protein complex subunit n=1 Tax=Trichinella spiralis TaxID=6334 RepID=A0ABR3K818_TRISP